MAPPYTERMTDRAGASDALPTLGRNVRTERRRQGLSVQDLSDRSGVSFGSISTLERGRGNPSLASIQKLASALGVPASGLLTPSEGEPRVVRAADRFLLPEDDRQPSDTRARRELLTPRSASTLQLIRTTLPAGFSNEGNAFRHIGTEVILVETGALEVVHGEDRVTLAEGDSMSYRCSTAHWWRNAHQGRTVVLGSVTPFEP